MSLSALPPVLLQSIMHGLGSSEIVGLALTHRDTMKAACSSFAWKFERAAVCFPGVNTSMLSAAPILRHTELSLTVRSFSGRGTDEDAAESFFTFGSCASFLASLPSDTRIGALSMDVQITHEHWLQLLASPSLQSLRVLRVYDRFTRPLVMDTAMINALAGLTCLHTLHIASVSTFWACMDKLKALTSLAFTDSAHPPQSLMLRIAWLPLKQLTVRRPALIDADFVEFFCAPRMDALEWLRLEDVSGMSAAMPANGCHAICRAMTKLRRLELVNCALIEALLPELVHASSLESVMIEPNLDPNKPQYAQTCPKPETILALLPRKPKLELQVTLRAQATWFDVCVQRSYMEQVRLRFADDVGLSRLGEQFKLRVV